VDPSRADLLDRLGRPLRSLRVSVTDRCNIRCQYCMPEREYTWLPRADVLDFEEIDRLVGVFERFGVDRVRLTGGEPLVRRNLTRLVELLARRPALRDLALTTNGVLLEEQMDFLAAAGLKRVTVSLDTLRPERFLFLTRSEAHAQVLAGIDAAAASGLPDLKLDTVVIRGFNDDEIGELLDFAGGVGAEIRFIEYMDVGGATRWHAGLVVSREEILATVAARQGGIPAEPLPRDGAAPAERFRLADGRTFGIIASTTAPFCGTCDRSRLTADGLWYLCLYAVRGVDLRGPLRGGASDDELAAIIAAAWGSRADRGAEERLGLPARAPLLAAGDLKRDPHLEMHTRGG
jgi:cyclic pyranopterin phosphate synthase